MAKGWSLEKTVAQQGIAANELYPLGKQPVGLGVERKLHTTVVQYVFICSKVSEA